MMPGFFMVTDVPERRVVQYKRVTAPGVAVVFLEDETALGRPVDDMPFADKTGIGVSGGGVLFEVAYLPDAGAVYFAVQPEDAEVGATLTATARAGATPYRYQWYKDDKQVVNVPDGGGELVASEPGEYFVVVSDAGGAQAFSRAVTVMGPCCFTTGGYRPVLKLPLPAPS
jgi:hypothetical protein